MEKNMRIPSENAEISEQIVWENTIKFQQKHFITVISPIYLQLEGLFQLQREMPGKWQE